ncbi:MAG: DNA adenine methylase [Clostridia bacterium]
MRAQAGGPARPFLKWAGGKSQLLQRFQDYYPAALHQGRIRRYVEPFVGSGAVLFHLLERHRFDDVLIVDRNPALMTAYEVIQRDVESLIDALDALQARFWSRAGSDRADLYQMVREEYNRGTDEPVRRAALLIFLNRTCFNGLYRVNRAGAFNVPMGRYDRPLICDRDNLRQVHRTLENVSLLTGEYSEAEAYIDEATFVYFDPPYRPLSATASFTAYHPGVFTDADQEHLATFFRRMSERGACVMLSNSDPKNIDPGDTFFDRLYAGFSIDRLPARRAINARADRRGAITELVITNYAPRGTAAQPAEEHPA